jgi:hypothetical protein
MRDFERLHLWCRHSGFEPFVLTVTNQRIPQNLLAGGLPVGNKELADL